MAFSGVIRRFTAVTGTVPETQISGAVFPNGRVAYQKYIAETDSYTTEFAGSIEDIVYKYGGQGGYSLTYIDPTAPDATGISPATGTASGGTNVTITGTGLHGPGVAVTIGGTAATGVSVNAAGTQITCTTPAGTAGARNVVVTTANGSDTLAGGFTYT